MARPGRPGTWTGRCGFSVNRDGLLDVLDPAFAPGISHREPGGLSVRESLSLLQSLQVPIVGADLVEMNPARDPIGIATVAAAKLLKELVACMLASNQSAT